MYKFYDCNSIINMKDKNGEPPGLFFVVSRGRGVGKTFSFAKYLLDTFFESGDKFVLICRNKGEVGSVARGIVSGALTKHYPGWDVVEHKRAHGTYSDIVLERLIEDDEGNELVEKREAGYTVSLNGADGLKKVSSIFHDAVHGFFDEFIPQNRRTYLPDEAEKFKTVVDSISRGIDSPHRYFPIYFSANAISMDNPYFLAMGLHKKIQPETKKYRGDGFVYQRYESAEISGLLDSSPVSRAMPNLTSSNYSEGAFYADDLTAVESPTAEWGPGEYQLTLIHEGVHYGFLYFPQIYRYYLSHKHDPTCNRVYRVTLDGDANLPVVKHSGLGKLIRDAIYEGAISYQSGSAKNVAYDFLV